MVFTSRRKTRTSRSGGNLKVKVKILCRLPEVFPWLQPKVGEIYEATYRPAIKHSTYKLFYAPVCVIDVQGKKICLKPEEYTICEE